MDIHLNKTRQRQLMRAAIECYDRGNALAVLHLVTHARLETDAILQLMIDLYMSEYDAIVFPLASHLASNGGDHWLIDVILSHLGLRADHYDLSVAALRRLSDKLANLEGRSADMCRFILLTRLINDVTRLNAIADAKLIRRLLDVAKVALPELESIFPPTAAAVRWPLAEPRTNPKLLPMPAPKARSARRSRQVVVAVENEGALGGLGPRWEHAFTSYGWQTVLHTFRTFRIGDDESLLSADLAVVLQACLQTRADVLILAESGKKEGLDQRIALLAELRSRQPDTTIVLFFPDPWNEFRWRELRQMAALADHIWSPFPSARLWHYAEFASKMLFYPIPLGPERPLPPLTGAMRPTFTGKVHRWSWIRNFWLVACCESGMDLHQSKPSSLETGSVLDSYDHYLTRLGATGASVNLTMRVECSRTLVGRSFEIPWAGALLIEESNDDIGYYFTDGEHMLTFTTLPELMGINELIRSQPERVEEIRRCGHAFAVERYSGERIVTAIDQALWP